MEGGGGGAPRTAAPPHPFILQNCVFNLADSYLIDLVHVPVPKQWLILGVSLTHLVETRDLFFLETEIVDNIFRWDLLKNMRQINSYDDMFQAIRALTVQRILKIRILSEKFFQNGCSCFWNETSRKIEHTNFLFRFKPMEMQRGYKFVPGKMFSCIKSGFS